MKIAIYPGSFDPITNGHLDVINRARRIFDKVVIAVARNASKSALFSAEERVQMIEANIVGRPNLSVLAFDGLIVDLAVELKAVALIRGMRAVSDFEHEFQMAQMNRHLDERVETVFLMPNEKYFFTSSSLIKQVHAFTNRKTDLVPDNVYRSLCDKFGTADQ
ncbi:MAG: pantetheine-phosphate adenylyltransferase [Opitutales bacterium]|jgi:pantetheine-phosphate adenylyltransferase